MKILILNWRDPKNPKAGGAEIVTMEHARAWVRAGHQVDWFTGTFPGAMPQEEIDGVVITRRGGSLTTLFHAVPFYLRQKNTYDIVIDEIHGLPYFTPLYVKKPVIAFIHEIAGEIWDHMYPFPFNLIGRLSELLYFRFYRHVPFWTDAPSTIDELVAKGIPRRNCTAIPCPITSTIKLKTHAKEKQPTFIFVSRLVKMKGIEDVITAFSRIHEALPDAKLWLVGGGDPAYVSYLKKQVAEQGLHESVVFHGRVDEQKKYELLGRVHLLLHASVKEGWGLVVLEAGIQQTPSIVYNVAGLRDVVVHDSTGWVVKENTPSELAKQAVLLIRDPKRYSQYQKQAQKRARSFRWDDATKESLKLITKAAAQRLEGKRSMIQ